MKDEVHKFFSKSRIIKIPTIRILVVTEERLGRRLVVPEHSIHDGRLIRLWFLLRWRLQFIYCFLVVMVSKLANSHLHKQNARNCV